MTVTTALTASGPRHRLSPGPALAGVTYVGAWLIGLTAFGVGPAADARDDEIVRYFADHRVATAVQSILIHGVAAVALLAVLAAIAKTRASTRGGHVAGVVGVALSLLQLAFDLWRSLLATGSTTTTLVELIDRVDGLKMFAFAVMIAASIGALRSATMIGPRMAAAGVAATVALAISGIAYAGDVDSLLVSALLSLPLLLVWVGNLGFAAARRTV